MSSGIYIQNIRTHRTKKKIKSILTPRVSKRKVAQYLVIYFVNKMIFHCGQIFPKNRLKLLHVARVFWFAQSRRNCASMFRNFKSIKLRSNNELLEPACLPCNFVQKSEQSVFNDNLFRFRATTNTEAYQISSLLLMIIASRTAKK